MKTASMLALLLLCSSVAWAAPSDNDWFQAYGRRAGARSLTEGRPNEALQQAAVDQARYMAEHHLGHQDFHRRAVQLDKVVPGGCRFKEVINISRLPRKHDAMREIFVTWQWNANSQNAVYGLCDYYGYAVYVKDGVMYACAILAYRDH